MTPAERRMAKWRFKARTLLAEIGRPGVSGVEVWRGPSEINGDMVVVIATGFQSASVNDKTGDMVQVYILPLDVYPAEAVRTGNDSAVCGTCEHRPYTGGACYVNVSWAPSNIWRTLERKGTECYPDDVPVEVFAGAAIRFGAYGDPAAVPLHVWEPLLRVAWRTTGYTQRWRDLDAAEWGWLMASCNCTLSALLANNRGWKSFHAYDGDAPPMPTERECLESSNGVSCLNCGGCDGRRGGPSWRIAKHGFRGASGQRPLFGALPTTPRGHERPRATKRGTLPVPVVHTVHEPSLLFQMTGGVAVPDANEGLSLVTVVD